MSTDTMTPADDTAALLQRRARVLGPAYRLFYEEPLHLVRGEGVWLHDATGRRYLDAYNNVAVVGHAHPRVVDAIARQAAVLNTHTRYLHEGIVTHAERLLATFPDEPVADERIAQVMYTCTGSEANDLALRIARAHTGARGLIVTRWAYHGVTAPLAEASPSLGAHMRQGEAVRLVDAPVARPGDDAATLGARFATGVQAAIDDLAAAGHGTAALLVDTVFSSDGVHTDPAGFLAPAVAAVRAAGGVLIADEVQGGFARTGDAMWGYMRHGVAPDIVTMGKPMGNGHPMAATAFRAPVIGAFAAQSRYFNTFGGNPVSAAAGLAVLDVIADESLQAHAARTGALLRAALRDLGTRDARLGEVRGTGLFIGADIVDAHGRPDADTAQRLVNGMRRAGVLLSATGPQGHTLKIRPPLPFDETHAALFIETTQRVLAGLHNVA